MLLALKRHLLYAWSWWDRKVTWVKGGEAALGVEIKLFPAHCFHCPPWELTSCSLQHSALPASQRGRQCLLVPVATQNPIFTVDGGKHLGTILWRWNQENLSPADVPGLCGGGWSLWISIGGKVWPHQSILQPGRMATNHKTDRLIYYLNSWRLPQAEKIKSSQRVKQTKNHQHLSLVLTESLGKEAHLHPKMMEVPTGPQALGSDCLSQWQWSENH